MILSSYLDGLLCARSGRWLDALFSVMLAKSSGAIKKHSSRYNLFHVFLFGI